MIEFDEHGLWTSHSVWFSRHGTLMKTLERSVSDSECGYFAHELEELLHVGLVAVGRLVVADEVLTPDSSRFWPAEHWAPGTTPPSTPTGTASTSWCATWATGPRPGSRWGWSASSPGIATTTRSDNHLPAMRAGCLRTHRSAGDNRHYMTEGK